MLSPIHINKKEVTSGDEQVGRVLSINPVNNKEVTFNSGTGNSESFEFPNGVFDERTSHRQVYKESSCMEIVENFLNKGQNGCIILHGQTSSGKTYRMTETIFPCATEQIFLFLKDERKEWKLSCSCVEIYNEKMYDLLGDTAKKPMTMMANFWPRDAESTSVTNKEDLAKVLSKAREKRRTSPTGKNSNSSRSHAIYRLELQVTIAANTVLKPTILLVDLAGDESPEGSNDQTETKNIKTR